MPPRKKALESNPEGGPPYLAGASFPATEEALDAEPGGEIAAAIREVALAFRDLSETLARVVGNGAHKPAAAPQAPALPAAPQPAPVAAAPATAPAASPGFYQAAPTQAPVQQAPVQQMQLPLPQAQPASQQAPVYSDKDLAYIIQVFQHFKTQPQYIGHPFDVPRTIQSLRQRLPHLNDEALWAAIRAVEAHGFANPAQALIRISPPAGEMPAMITIV